MAHPTSASPVPRRTASSRARSVEAALQGPRERILRAFAERARQTGIRGVVLADVAADLGMSKKTLYQHFASKDALVHALVEDWVARMRAGVELAAEQELRPAELIRRWAQRWSAGLGRFSPGFWRELERDYPAAHALIAESREVGRRRARRRLGRALRPGVQGEVANELFQLAVQHFGDPQVCERLGMTRQDAVLAALEVWIAGALADGGR